MSQQIQKDWMDADRFSEVYRDGVKEFIKFANENKDGNTICSCPCVECRNKKPLTFDLVQHHLLTRGVDKTYRVWALHGEKPSNSRIEHPIEEHVEVEFPSKENVEGEEVGIGNYVDAAYELHNEALNDTQDHEEPYDPEPDLDKRYKKYKKLAKKKLYPSCEGPETTLSAIVELQNMKKMFGWSGNSVTYLLSTLRRWFPKGNTFPSKYPVMKAMLKDLGMDATCIHACENHCILYWKEHENALNIPICGTPRFKFKEGNQGKKESKEPCKVLRYFPLGPRLKRLYTIPWIAHAMTWHHRADTSWNNMRHPVDSVQWQKMKSIWSEFAKEIRNVWLGIVTDGFNPRGIQSSRYSCWPVIVVPYNLPPSLCMKSEFQIMTLLIPGPKAPGQNIDVFLQPLIDELKQLWEEGVEAYDMHLMQPFTCKAILMWGIRDLPAFGNLSGCTVHGYKACHVCADDTISIRLHYCNKIVYLNYRRFLKMDHPFRLGKFLGLKTEEMENAPERLTGKQVIAMTSSINYKPSKLRKSASKKRKINDLVEGDVNGDEGVDSSVGGDVTKVFYKKSRLFDLPTWEHNPIRHCVDVMHIEKNVTEHLVDTILDVKNKSKDT